MDLPTSIRERVRRDHRIIHAILAEVGELADEVISGRRHLWPILERNLDDLRRAVARHHALESQDLMPALTRGNGWGVILARHLAQVHRHQVELVEEATTLDQADVGDRAVRVRILSEVLRDDMRQEARWLAQLATHTVLDHDRR